VILGGIGAPASVVGGPHQLAGRLMPQLLVRESYQKLKTPNMLNQQPNPSNVLGVFGLSIRTQERDLEDEFCRFGRVEKVTIVYDQRVGSGTLSKQNAAFKTFSSLTAPVVLVSSK